MSIGSVTGSPLAGLSMLSPRPPVREQGETQAQERAETPAQEQQERATSPTRGRTLDIRV